MKNSQTVYWINEKIQNENYILMATEKGVCWIGWAEDDIAKGKKWLEKCMIVKEVKEDKMNIVLQKAAKALREYLEGKNESLNNESIHLNFDIYGTEFQKQIWKEIAKIKYGQTKTYGELAVSVGKPSAARAVGAACGKNPIAFLIPCHRVLGSNGSLTGYAGGVSTKEKLLKMERSVRSF